MSNSFKFVNLNDMVGLVFSSFLYELDITKQMISTTESLLTDHAQNQKRIIDQNAKSLTDEQKEDYYQFHSDDHYHYNITFPNIFRYSMLTYIYSMFEKYLNDLCIILKRQLNIKIDLKDINGNGIKRAELFLSKVIEIPFPHQNSEWQSIINIFSEIRNIVVHRNGELKSNHENSIINSFIINNSDKISINNYFVEFNDKFLIYFIEQISTFTYLLNEIIDIKIQKLPI